VSLKLITYSYNNQCIQLADMLQAELAGIGVDVQIETMDVLDDTVAADDFDFAVMNYAMAPTGSAQYLISMLFESASSGNVAHYSNEKVDELSNQLKATFDEDERTAIAKSVCEQVVNDRVYDFVCHQQLICAYSDKVTGFVVNPTEYYLITNTIDIAE
jgi:peptide/nickel transport system substrate-binding protein